MELPKPILQNGEWVIRRNAKSPLVIKFENYQAYLEYLCELQKDQSK